MRLRDADTNDRGGAGAQVAADAAAITALLRDVRRIEVQSRRLVNGVMAGGYRSVFKGSGIEFDEVREYAEGDDPRTVDWNVTARVGRPFVKKFIDERELTLLFLVDLSPSMEAGLGVWSMREAAARVCACLALSAVRSNDLVSMIGFDDRVRVFAPPRKGTAHALRCVRDTLALPPAASATDLRPPLELAARALRRRAVVFLVSDFFAPPTFEDALVRCARWHDVIAVRLIPPEIDPPPLGLVRLRDPESGRARVADLGSDRVRRAYAEQVARARGEIEALLRRARVDRMDVEVPRERARDAIARPILEFFRLRELRGEKR